MDNIYKTTVNNNLEFYFNETDISKANIIKIENSKYHIINNNKTYIAEVSDSDFNKKSYQVKINNNTYNVNILNDLDVLIKAMGFEVGTSKLVNSIKAPMPGLILDINVRVGQGIKENDALLVLEAMKMENNIISPRSGIIKSISANKGDAVEKGQLLIEFE
jgi:biotin carboxyl carrier protein